MDKSNRDKIVEKVDMGVTAEETTTITTITIIFHRAIYLKDGEVVLAVDFVGRRMEPATFFLVLL